MKLILCALLLVIGSLTYGQNLLLNSKQQVMDVFDKMENMHFEDRGVSEREADVTYLRFANKEKDLFVSYFFRDNVCIYYVARMPLNTLPTLIYRLNKEMTKVDTDTWVDKTNLYSVDLIKHKSDLSLVYILF